MQSVFEVRPRLLCHVVTTLSLNLIHILTSRLGYLYSLHQIDLIWRGHYTDHRVAYNLHPHPIYGMWGSRKNTSCDWQASEKTNKAISLSYWENTKLTNVPFLLRNFKLLFVSIYLLGVGRYSSSHTHELSLSLSFTHSFCHWINRQIQQRGWSFNCKQRTIKMTTCEMKMADWPKFLLIFISIARL